MSPSSNESGDPTATPPSSGSSWINRLSTVRHDLRNPLGEIVGFAEVLIEESQEQQLTELLPGLQTVRQSANRILADVNHALNPDTLRLSPQVLAELQHTIQRLCDQIIAASRQLSDECDALGHPTFGEDLLRIMGSARRMREVAPNALEILIATANEVGATHPSPDAAAEETLANALSPNPAFPVSGTILIVDDQEANRTLLARRLGKQGYKVSLAENGLQAIERLRSRPFDLMLLDILMPEMDGREVLRRVKADPELRHIPVLMLSALDELGAVVQCIELGAEDYLPKPFPAAILQARVQACLASKRMSDQLRKYTEWLFGKTLFTQAVATPGSLKLSQQERTLLFADIRGFTRWTESRQPEEAVAMLNSYFESAEKLWANSSVIKTEYTGDEIMVVFSSALEAVRIAHALRVEIGRLLGELGLGIGVGVHTGLVIEGLMGGAQVKAYRFVGDTVNTTSRISKQAGPGQVLLSETTYNRVASFVSTASPFELSAKGKADPLKVRLLEALITSP